MAAMVKCPRCQVSFADGTELCPTDGARLGGFAADTQGEDPLLGTVIAGRLRLLRCIGQGGMYSHGDGIPKDEARAVAIYDKVCSQGNAEGCRALGVMVNDGRGIAKDLGRARDLYEKACDGGDVIGCRGLGQLYDFGEGVPVDAARAEALYDKACTGEDAVACRLLGDLKGKSTKSPGKGKGKGKGKP